MRITNIKGRIGSRRPAIVKYPELRSKKWLREAYSRKSSSEIAKELGCTYKTVRDAVRMFGFDEEATTPKVSTRERLRQRTNVIRGVHHGQSS